jgi:hypothetical protein
MRRRCTLSNRAWRRLAANGVFLVATALCAQDAAPPQPAPAQTPEQSPPQSSPAASAPVTDSADAPVFATPPVAIVPLDSKISGAASSVTGAMQVWNGRAYLSGSGSITAGADTAQVTLPYRGVLRICASTTVKLAVDSSVPAGEHPGLLMALDRGAIETSYAAGTNADVLLTPDFRILIGGPGSSDLKVRLGDGGDTCIDNAGADAPYVVVTSLFDNGLYRVQPGQRVMLQHGSLKEVVDAEKEPCGCPAPPANAVANEFPLAQSEGLAPTPPPTPTPPQPGNLSAQATAPLVYMGGNNTPKTVSIPPADSTPPPPAVPPQPSPPAQKKKPGVFKRIGHFFRRVFGAE